MIRLDKFLSNANVGSRRQVKELIKNGAVTVEGLVCKDGSIKIEERSKVTCQGKAVIPLADCVYMLNKPAGVVSATTDDVDKTVVDLLRDENRRDLFPIGRLDKDTEGLILITNNGGLSHNLLSPRKHVSKTYLCVSNKALNDGEMKKMEEGIDIGDDKITMSSVISPTTLDEACAAYNIAMGNVDSLFERIDRLSVYTPDSIYAYYLTISEGRYHQVKRMFSFFGGEILYLNRIRFAGLRLDKDLHLGAYRLLNEEEIEALTP